MIEDQEQSFDRMVRTPLKVRVCGQQKYFVIFESISYENVF
jgi:hypothetical protein